MSEREAVVAAIQSSKNLGVAARHLGASRRTLQNRMRFYGLPRGQSGRPKETLPFRVRHVAGMPIVLGVVGVVAVLAGALVVQRWLSRTQTPQMVGLDAFCLR